VARPAAAGLLAYAVLLRPRLLTWGASAEEARAALPGDDVVAARWQTTRAVSVAAPARQVWPWLVQMGYGRAGWYSYDRLERLVGAGRFTDGGSARRVIPELQHLPVGGVVPLSDAGGLTVVVSAPDTALVLHLRMNLRTGGAAGPHDRAVLDWTWAFVLVPTGGSSCRLVARVRASYRPRAVAVLLVTLVEPVHLVMERKLLRTVARRAAPPARRGDGPRDGPGHDGGRPGDAA
jgi:hypothetical protein